MSCSLSSKLLILNVKVKRLIAPKNNHAVHIPWLKAARPKVLALGTDDLERVREEFPLVWTQMVAIDVWAALGISEEDLKTGKEEATRFKWWKGQIGDVSLRWWDLEVKSADEEHSVSLSPAFLMGDVDNVG